MSFQEGHSSYVDLMSVSPIMFSCAGIAQVGKVVSSHPAAECLKDPERMTKRQDIRIGRVK